MWPPSRLDTLPTTPSYFPSVRHRGDMWSQWPTGAAVSFVPFQRANILRWRSCPPKNKPWSRGEKKEILAANTLCATMWRCFEICRGQYTRVTSGGSRRRFLGQVPSISERSRVRSTRHSLCRTCPRMPFQSLYIRYLAVGFSDRSEPLRQPLTHQIIARRDRYHSSANRTCPPPAFEHDQAVPYVQFQPFLGPRRVG